MPKYLLFNPNTLEIIDSVECNKWNAPRNSVKLETLPDNAGFAVVLNKGLTATEYIIDHREKTVYNTANFAESKQVDYLGEIKLGWTLDKPTTEFDTWINGAWVTDTQAEFEANVNRVDNTRRSLYSSMSDPLISEANFERLLNNEEAAVELENQAIAAREKIRTENPWPTLN